MTEEASSRAVASLVLGILSYVACPLVFGIAAVVLGSGERHGVARAGVILGWINIVLTLITVVIFLVFFVFAGATAVVGGN
jgi:hypothetical protein